MDVMAEPKFEPSFEQLALEAFDEIFLLLSDRHDSKELKRLAVLINEIDKRARR